MKYHSYTLFLSFLLLYFLPFASTETSLTVTLAAISGKTTIQSATPSFNIESTTTTSPNNGTFTFSNGTLGSLAELKNTTPHYLPLYQPYFNSTPVFHNVSGITVNLQIVVLNAASEDTPAAVRDTSITENGITPRFRGLLKRHSALPAGTCALGTPCTNGACCSNVTHRRLDPLNL